MEREKFGSRLGFILVSAGCAIGLGNVWRFPYITGEYGGAAFVLMYLVFLAVFALPVAHHGVRRRARQPASAIARSYDELEPACTKWHCVQVACACGQLPAHDVLHYGGAAGCWPFVVNSATGTFVGLETLPRWPTCSTACWPTRCR